MEVFLLKRTKFLGTIGFRKQKGWIPLKKESTPLYFGPTFSADYV
jgi:hypothetical protein